MKVLNIVNNKLIFGGGGCNLIINNNINKEYEVNIINNRIT